MYMYVAFHVHFVVCDVRTALQGVLKNGGGRGSGGRGRWRGGGGGGGGDKRYGGERGVRERGEIEREWEEKK